MLANLQLDHKITMYGVCLRINGIVNHEPFARAVCDPFDCESWGVTIFNADGSITDVEVPCTDDSQADIHYVESLIRLYFRQNFAKRVPCL